MLEEVESYISEHTIITDDFNAFNKECGSLSFYKMGSGLKELVEKSISVRFHQHRIFQSPQLKTLI
jgi:hypothetical protein